MLFMAGEDLETSKEEVEGLDKNEEKYEERKRNIEDSALYNANKALATTIGNNLTLNKNFNAAATQYMTNKTDNADEIQKNDYQMREWINHHGLNTVTVLSKVDLVKQNDLNKRIQEIKKNFGSEVLLFTAKNNRYNEEVIKYIFDNILYLDDEN